MGKVIMTLENRAHRISANRGKVWRCGRCGNRREP